VLAETRKNSFIPLVIFGIILYLASQFPSQSVVALAQDPLAGSRVFGSQGRSECHAVNEVGAKVGPDLGQIEVHRSFSDLAATLWNHPFAMVKMSEASPAFPQLYSAGARISSSLSLLQNFFKGFGGVGRRRSTK